MWIKTKNGDYFNADYLRRCYLDEDGDTRCDFANTHHGIYWDGDVREDIIANIISGTKVMEVR